MKTLFRVTFGLAALATLAAAQAGTATYLFNNSYAPVEASAPNLGVVDPLSQNAFGTATLYGATRSVYNTAGTVAYSTNAGLTLNAASVITPTSYSLEMVVALDPTSGNGYRKLADVSDRNLDTGYYVLNQNLDVYNLGAGTAAVTAGTYNYLVLTVNNGTLKGYVNGALDFTFTGSTIMDGNAFDFFLDDQHTGGAEYANVSVGLLRLRSGVLTDGQIATLAQNPYQAVPEPSAFAALGLGILAVLRRRRR